MIGIELQQIGNVKQVVIPAGWDAVPQVEDLFSQSWRMAFTASAQPDVEIAFYYRGIPIDKGSAETFREIAEAKPPRAEPQKLTPIEIISLRLMLGFENCGNNQYTNTAPKDSYDGPVFHVVAAQTISVSGNVVLYVRGEFKSEVHFAGVFCPCEPSGLIIQEIGIHAPSKELLDEYEPVFQNVLDSIVWNPW